LILSAGTLGLWAGTDGWTAWTAESARRLSVLNNPQVLPQFDLRDAAKQTKSFADFERPIILIDFVYTRCPTVCLAMGAEFRQLQSDLSSLGLTDQVQLLSLSFDPVHDGPAELAAYLKRFSANPNQWTAAKFESKQAMVSILNQLGVVVIPEPRLGFVHNAAIYLVHNGVVVGIYDIDDSVSLLEAVQWQLSSS